MHFSFRWHEIGTFSNLNRLLSWQIGCFSSSYLMLLPLLKLVAPKIEHFLKNNICYFFPNFFQQKYLTWFCLSPPSSKPCWPATAMAKRAREENWNRSIISRIRISGHILREIHGSDEERKCRQVTREFRRAFVISPSYKTCGFSPSSFSLLLNTIEPWWQNQVRTSIAIANCIHITIIKKTSQFSNQNNVLSISIRTVDSFLRFGDPVSLLFFPFVFLVSIPSIFRSTKHGGGGIPSFVGLLFQHFAASQTVQEKEKRKQTTRRKNQPCYKSAGHAQFPKFFRGKGKKSHSRSWSSENRFLVAMGRHSRSLWKTFWQKTFFEVFRRVLIEEFIARAISFVVA